MSFAGALCAPAQAAGVVVDATPCASAIKVDADQATLQEVLERLAGAMGFKLVVRADLTERVTRQLAGSPEDVLKRLMHGKNLVTDSNPASKCKGRETLTTVWVLPVGEVAPTGAVAGPAAPTVAESSPQARAPLRQQRPRGTRKRMSEAEWQQMKRDYAAGKVKADPETGMPVPVEPADTRPPGTAP